MSVIVHYCICAKGLECTVTQNALKLQELVKEKINILTLLDMLDSLDSYVSKESKLTQATNIRRMEHYLRELKAILDSQDLKKEL